MRQPESSNLFVKMKKIVMLIFVPYKNLKGAAVTHFCIKYSCLQKLKKVSESFFQKRSIQTGNRSTLRCKHYLTVASLYSWRSDVKHKE